MPQYASLLSRALEGMHAQAVQVEVHFASGLPQFTLVGLAETEVKEARERVRAAIVNAGFEFPANKRITVNLAPADLPKDSGRFDLPIALGILAASGQLNAAALADVECAGELSLSGALRPIRGALAMAIAAQQAGHQLILPAASAQEAALLPDAQVYAAEHLLQVVAHFARNPEIAVQQGMQRVQAQAPSAARHGLDMAEVKGHSAAKRALEIAAAGGHSALLVGPPGSGKSMLAARFSSLLPPLAATQALEAAAVQSLAGRFDVQHWGQRRTFAPHHTASAVALVGGGSPPRPGEISLAHHGVLFLDELPEFPRAALEALREPLESGHITISRAARRADFPAQFQLIAAMNPCPCGYLGASQKACRCSPDQVVRYQGKISGPLLDRLDLHLEVHSLPTQDLLTMPAGESSNTIAQRVAAAQGIALTRQGCLNAQLGAQDLSTHAALDATAQQFLAQTAEHLGWSARATHRVLKLARSIADLADEAAINSRHLAEAVQYRRALRLLA
ncbi:MAG: YifB family Mg chelatase-like AAA ATPase [Brachymonas sp.]